jgi:hypothetical protein
MQHRRGLIYFSSSAFPFLSNIMSDVSDPAMGHEEPKPIL